LTLGSRRVLPAAGGGVADEVDCDRGGSAAAFLGGSLKSGLGRTVDARTLE